MVQRYKKYSRKPRKNHIKLSLILHILTHANPRGQAWVFFYTRLMYRREKSPEPPNFIKKPGKAMF